MRKAVILAVVLSLGAFAQPAGAVPSGSSVCVSHTDVAKSCDTNGHELVETVALYWVYPAFGAYTGTIRILVNRTSPSALTMADFRCHYSGNAANDFVDDTNGTICDTSSSNFGNPGWVFRHRCFSYNKNTTTLGGNGVWTCGTIYA